MPSPTFSTECTSRSNRRCPSLRGLSPHFLSESGPRVLSPRHPKLRRTAARSRNLQNPSSGRAELLAKSPRALYLCRPDREFAVMASESMLSSVVEHILHTDGVVGSNPTA